MEPYLKTAAYPLIARGKKNNEPPRPFAELNVHPGFDI